MIRTTFLQDDNAVWLKGNLHAHSTNSDGHLTPERLAEGYRERGYDFLAITDHDVFYEHPELCKDNFLVLPGMELTAPLNRERSAHLGIIQKGEKGSIEQGQVFQLKSRGEVLEFIEKYHEDYMIILNHPNWSMINWDEVADIPHLSALEIYNHSCALGCLNGDSTYFWMALFHKGKKMWAIAADDCHNGREKDPGWPFEAISCDSFGGFIKVKARERTRESIMEAMAAGSFYASNGPEIYDFYVEDNKFYVKCSPCRMILVSGDFGCYQRTYGDGITEFSKGLRGREKFVRVQCVDEQGRIASSNPIFLE